MAAGSTRAPRAALRPWRDDAGPMRDQEAVGTAFLEERLRRMETRMHLLRMSRRVLMNLLIQSERESRETIAALEARNRKLAHANARAARRAWEARLAPERPQGSRRHGSAHGHTSS